MKVKKSVVFLFLFVPVIGLFAQSNQLIDELLQQDEALLGHTAYLVLTAAEIIPDDAAVADAIDFLQSSSIKMGRLSLDKPVFAGEFSYLTMHFFKIEGGILYTLFPGSRYGLREMVYKGFLDNSVTMFQYLPGQQIVQIVGDVTRRYEESSYQ